MFCRKSTLTRRIAASLSMASLAALALGGCNWATLAVGALTTPTSVADASTNVAVQDHYAYAARSAKGIEIIDLDDGRRRRLAPSQPGDHVDDIAVADGLLFALDATAPGYLTSYRIDAAGDLHRVGAPVAVPVGPFSGVSAAHGLVIVSGGTSQLTLRGYTPQGELDRVPATADFGRGQPDVVLSADGMRALISTHVQGPYFGLTVADVQSHPLAVRSRGYVAIDGAGFTGGGFKPANFPLQAVVADDYALVAHGAGLSVIAIAPDSAPRLLRTLSLPMAATAIAFDRLRRNAYVVGAKPTPVLVVVDLGRPGSPRVLDRHPLPSTGSPSAIALRPHQLVVAMQQGGTYIESR
jgi:hypothetical protein